MTVGKALYNTLGNKQLSIFIYLFIYLEADHEEITVFQDSEKAMLCRGIMWDKNIEIIIRTLI